MENTELDSLRDVVKKQSQVITDMSEALTKLRTDSSNFSDEACWCFNPKDGHTPGCVLAKKVINN